MDRVGASAQAIADALAPTPQAPAARWRWGTVVSVGSGGTMNVSIGGATVAGIRCAQHVVGANVGDRVRVLYCGTEAMVDAVRASDRLMSLPAISSAVVLKDDRLDRDGTHPSSNQYSRILGVQDKDGENVAYIQASQYTDGTVGAALVCYGEDGNGNAVHNVIRANVAPDGTRSYEVTDQAAFRSAIGMSAANAALTASNLSSGDLGLLSCGPVHVLRLNNAKLSSSLAAGGDVQVGTIPSGSRPPAQVASRIRCDAADMCELIVLAGGGVLITNYGSSALASGTLLRGSLAWITV